MARTSKGIFLAGMLAGAAAFAVTAQLVQRSEPTRPSTQVTADTSTPVGQLQQHDTFARGCPTSGREQENCGSNAPAEASPQAGLARERSGSESQADAEWNAFVGGM